METPVIDMHSHVGNEGKMGMADDADTYVRIMDAAGVDRSPVSGLFYGEARRCNENTARFVSQHPDRFMGVAFVTPHYPDEAIPELEHAFDQLGMVFLKLYPDYFRKPIDDPGYDPIFEWCSEREIIVKSHTSFTGGADTLTDPLRFIGLAKKYPRIRWVLAHSGNSTAGQYHAIEAAQSSRNVYVETCTSFGEHGTIERLVAGAGSDRVLYGSDMPLMDARPQVGRIATANISAEDKRRVLGLNAMDLLGLS